MTVRYVQGEEGEYVRLVLKEKSPEQKCSEMMLRR